MKSLIRVTIATLGVGFAIVIVAFSVFSFLSAARSPKTLGEKNVNSSPQAETQSFYFQDVIVLVTKDNPKLALYLSASRQKANGHISQATQIKYFDGTSWIQDMHNSVINSDQIQPNRIIKSWVVNNDEISQLKFSAKGEVTINELDINFATGTLENEITLQSSIDSSSQLSRAEGTLTINGIPHQAFLAYKKTYFRYSDLYQPNFSGKFGYFWDNQNFYYLQTNTADSTNPLAQSFKLFAIENNTGQVQKSFNVEDNSSETSNEYSIPDINLTSIQFNLLNQDTPDIYVATGIARYLGNTSAVVGIYSIIN